MEERRTLTLGSGKGARHVMSTTQITFKNVTLSAISDQQYGMIAKTRDNFNTLLWQIPALSLSAQAFLFQIILGDASSRSKQIAAVLSISAALASCQLMAKHRFGEISYTRLLDDVEQSKGLQNINQHIMSTNIFSRWSSFVIWQALLLLFGAAAIFSAWRVCA